MMRNKSWFISLLVAILTVGMLAGCGTKAEDAERVLRTGNEAAPLPAIEAEAQEGDQEVFDSYVYSVEKLKAEYT